ncbi:MBL fold metallo-hydrolase [Exilibacterium tricleocarpae]|uniref:MBL fold metallo-hydrolase n=1 Tax=Exilibacterium tricleocarpae TaxID=2591008 RepID=A0A545ST95_9GAMM|nr:MBL fold metallo-hydrolase [Exilibacterium tricleocarpae]
MLSTVGFFLLLGGCSTVPTVDARANSNEQPIPLTSVLHKKKWIHGAIDCKSNADPAIEVFRYDHSSYVLRQNKCLSFEAPFIYVLFGEDKALVLDTGATESALDFPLYKTVESLIGEHAQRGETIERALLVIHSHSHSDHYAGDSQFEGKPHITVVEPTGAAVQHFFGFSKWPDDEAQIDLGARKLTIIPTPGHQEDAIAVYDSKTKWLLTGDTLYPGYIYVRDWQAYKKSIARLVSFSKAHEITAILGAHIEMTTKAGEYYPIGTVYQPNEAGLALQIEDLVALNSQLKNLDKPKKIVFDKFIIVPMNIFQKFFSSVAKWFVQ